MNLHFIEKIKRFFRPQIVVKEYCYEEVFEQGLKKIKSLISVGQDISFGSETLNLSLSDRVVFSLKQEKKIFRLYDQLNSYKDGLSPEQAKTLLSESMKGYRTKEFAQKLAKKIGYDMTSRRGFALIIPSLATKGIKDPSYMADLCKFDLVKNVSNSWLGRAAGFEAFVMMLSEHSNYKFLKDRKTGKYILGERSCLIAMDPSLTTVDFGSPMFTSRLSPKEIQSIKNAMLELDIECFTVKNEESEGIISAIKKKMTWEPDILNVDYLFNQPNGLRHPKFDKKKTFTVEELIRRRASDSMPALKEAVNAIIFDGGKGPQGFPPTLEKFPKGSWVTKASLLYELGVISKDQAQKLLEIFSDIVKAESSCSDYLREEIVALNKKIGKKPSYRFHASVSRNQ